MAKLYTFKYRPIIHNDCSPPQVYSATCEEFGQMAFGETENIARSRLCERIESQCAGLYPSQLEDKLTDKGLAYSVEHLAPHEEVITLRF